MTRRLFVFQGGGPTAVINATLSGILEGSAAEYDEVLGLRHSLELIGQDNLVDLTALISPNATQSRKLLANTPGALLGSSRTRVQDSEICSLLELMRAYQATDIVGIGGNGTMTLLHKLSDLASRHPDPLRIVGAPKTVDNDLPGVAFAPGYGSAARFVATAVRDFDCDFRAMQTFDSVTILETMGRDTGWLAAASVLLKADEKSAPHMVLVPEREFDAEEFLQDVNTIHESVGRVFIVTNEMLLDSDGRCVGEDVQNGPKDDLDRTMYSLSVGTGNYLAQLIYEQLGLQARCLRPGNLGRALTSCVSEVDQKLAIEVGREAVRLIASNTDEAMVVTVNPDQSLGSAPVAQCSGKQPLFSEYLSPGDRYGISDNFREFAMPIIGDVEGIYSID